MENIYVNSEIGICTECILHAGGKKEQVSIVISPLKVTERDNSLKISSGCNLWKACHNPHCNFTEIAHPPREK